MLFDLRAGGRRRFIQAVYLFLAILLGGGLVLFGIGGDVSGGLFDAFREDSSQDNATEQLEQRLEDQEQRLQTNPQDAVALAEVAKLHYQIAGTGENFNEDQGAFTEEGLAELRQAERAWDRYLATEPEEINTGVAIQMVQAFSPGALNEPDKAVEAMELYIDARPESSALFAQLAQYAYLAGQTRKGDLAADRAVALEDEGERKDLREQLDAIKAQALQQQAQEAATTPAPAPGE